MEQVSLLHDLRLPLLTGWTRAAVSHDAHPSSLCYTEGAGGGVRLHDTDSCTTNSLLVCPTNRGLTVGDPTSC